MQLADCLGLDEDSFPERIEAYDISNTFGFQSVGSMIVYENGRPKNSDYRKFRIQTVQGANDYASMEEVLTRRFKHAFDEMGAKAVHNAFEDERDIALKVHLDCGFREVRRENGIIHLMITAEDYEKISE